MGFSPHVGDAVSNRGAAPNAALDRRSIAASITVKAYLPLIAGDPLLSYAALVRPGSHQLLESSHAVFRFTKPYLVLFMFLSLVYIHFYLRLQQLGHVIRLVLRRRRDQREDVAPLLRPRIAQQVGANHSIHIERGRIVLRGRLSRSR
jgi:hypothetical protein